MLLRGSYKETFDSRFRECNVSTVVFHPPGEVHADHFDESGGRLFRLEMKQQWLERAQQHTTQLNGPAEFARGSIAWLATRLYKEFYQLDDLSPLVIEGLGLEIVCAAARIRTSVQSGSLPHWLERAKQFVHDCFADDFSVSKVADIAGVHPVHLARVFRQFYGCTVGEYVRRLRIEFASLQLSTSDSSLAEIAAAAGFSDQSHFTKSFKLLTGMTPAQYRTVFRSAR